MPWNQDLFDDDLNSALQTSFADLKDQKYLDQWTKLAFGDEKRASGLWIRLQPQVGG